MIAVLLWLVIAVVIAYRLVCYDTLGRRKRRRRMPKESPELQALRRRLLEDWARKDLA